jgi:hypothetical protein
VRKALIPAAFQRQIFGTQVGREQLQPIILLMQLLNFVAGSFSLGSFTQAPYDRLHKLGKYLPSNVGKIAHVS